MGSATSMMADTDMNPAIRYRFLWKGLAICRSFFHRLRSKRLV